MKRRTALLLALFLCAVSALAASGPKPTRPSDWATPVSGTSVANLYLVEAGFYRGAQPTAAGFKELSALGVRTVLDVAGGAGDEPLVRDGSVRVFHVPMSAWGLHDDLVLRALKIMADPANRPLMIHCRLGADRTGALVALYRVVVQGWTKEQAVLEMNQGGYHHSALWRNLDNYVLKADVAAFRKELGLGGPAAPAAPSPNAPVLAVLPGFAPGAAAAAPQPH